MVALEVKFLNATLDVVKCGADLYAVQQGQREPPEWTALVSFGGLAGGVVAGVMGYSVTHGAEVGSTIEDLLQLKQIGKLATLKDKDWFEIYKIGDNLYEVLRSKESPRPVEPRDQPDNHPATSSEQDEYRNPRADPRFQRQLGQSKTVVL